MKKITIKRNNINIYMVDGSDELSECELTSVEKLNPKWFVYYYKVGSYDGNGFAVWKIGRKYYYSDLGHCSCYGPTESLNSIPVNSLKDMEKFCDNYNYGNNVVNFIKTKKL